MGMTHIFIEQGRRCPVTVVETQPSSDNPDGLLLNVGDFVDVQGVSKGCGFQGGMKRWNWSGGPQSHGSMSHRRVGSIGASASPSRVLRGQHMPGHMGNQRVTVQNLQVVKLDKQNNLVIIKGAIPGHRNSKLIIRIAKKKAHLRKEDLAKDRVESKPEKKAEAETK